MYVYRIAPMLLHDKDDGSADVQLHQANSGLVSACIRGVVRTRELEGTLPLSQFCAVHQTGD